MFIPLRSWSGEEASSQRVKTPRYVTKFQARPGGSRVQVLSGTRTRCPSAVSRPSLRPSHPRRNGTWPIPQRRRRGRRSVTHTGQFLSSSASRPQPQPSHSPGTRWPARLWRAALAASFCAAGISGFAWPGRNGLTLGHVSSVAIILQGTRRQIGSACCRAGHDERQGDCDDAPE